MQVKAEQSIETMLSLPSEVVVGPMSASLYGYFYGHSYCESSNLNPNGFYNNTSSALDFGGTITSPRPNTPPYFPQLPFAKLYSPRSPRRHVPAPGVLSVQNTKSFPEPHTGVTTLYTNKSKKENGVATICSKVTPNGENHLSTDSEGRISSRTATSTTTNKLLNHHDADIVGDTNKIKTNKTSLLINDQPGSKQQEQDTSTTPTPALSYNLPSENDKLDVAVVAPQHPHVDKHEANKPYLHHSTQSQNLVNSDTIIEDVTSVLVSKPSVLSRTLAEHPTSINSTSDAVVQNKTSVDTTLSSPTPTHKTLPSFHFPFGTTRLSVEEINVELERIKRELNQLVDSSLNSGKYSDSLISHSCFGQVAKVRSVSIPCLKAFFFITICIEFLMILFN